ncbi:hypothetical protein N7528_002717 [Penicillium herquei]|nr:hypothetical protein N7528_002717 [Penicillium herquei]
MAIMAILAYLIVCADSLLLDATPSFVSFAKKSGSLTLTISSGSATPKITFEVQDNEAKT